MDEFNTAAFAGFGHEDLNAEETSDLQALTSAAGQTTVPAATPATAFDEGLFRAELVKKFHFPVVVPAASTSSFRAVADLISRLDDPLSQATPAYSSLSKEQGVAWSSVFGLPKVGSRGLMKDKAADHFTAFFSTPDSFLRRSSVELVAPNILRRWGDRLSLNSLASDNELLVLINSKLTGRVASSKECARTSDVALLSYLKLHRLIADDAPLDRANQIHLLTDARPSVGELGTLRDDSIADIDRRPALPAGVSLPTDSKKVCDPFAPARNPVPKQPPLGPDSASIPHRNFILCRSCDILLGFMVVLLNACGAPNQVLQYKGGALWDRDDTSAVYDSISTDVWVLSPTGLERLAAFDSRPWPNIPASPPFATTHRPLDILTMDWSSPLSPPAAMSYAGSTHGNPLDLSFTQADFVRPGFDSSSSQASRDRAANAAGFLALTHGFPDIVADVLGSGVNIDDMFTVSNIRQRVLDTSLHSLEILASTAKRCFLNLRTSSEYAKDMNTAGGFHLLHVANSTNPVAQKHTFFVSVDHLRRTWEVWAILYDSVVCLAGTFFFSDILAPLFLQLSFVGTKDGPNWQHYDIRFTYSRVDAIMFTFSQLVNSATPRLEKWERPRWKAEFTRLAVFPSRAELSTLASDWDRTHGQNSPSSPPFKRALNRGAAGANDPVHKAPKAMHVSPNKKPPHVPQIRVLCRNELLKLLAVKSTGCKQANCPRQHTDLLTQPKPVLLSLVEPLPDVKLRNDAITAIGNL